MVDLQSQYKNIKSEIDNAVTDVIESGQYINGPVVQEFSLNLAKYMSVKHVIPCANGTDALQVALMALDLNPGDEVITTDFIFAATVEVIALLNLKPILIDVDLETFNIDCNKLKKAIGPKTKAIVPVHLFGQPADMEKIMQISKEHNLYVIEDNAQAHLAKWGNKYTGTFGNINATSFYPTKNLGGIGDGGAITFNKSKHYNKISKLRNYGSIKKNKHIYCEKPVCKSFKEISNIYEKLRNKTFSLLLFKFYFSEIKI